ncbi:MAG: hypothetical protein AAF673_05565, partial [Pseudomonadota bacterium]
MIDDKKIYDLIASDKLDEALHLTQQQLGNENSNSYDIKYVNEVINLKGNLERLRRKIRKNIIYDRDAEILENKIRDALISLVDEIKTEPKRKYNRHEKSRIGKYDEHSIKNFLDFNYLLFFNYALVLSVFYLLYNYYYDSGSLKILLSVGALLIVFVAWFQVKRISISKIYDQLSIIIFSLSIFFLCLPFIENDYSQNGRYQHILFIGVSIIIPSLTKFMSKII